jgi:hypothetical protein
MQRVLLTATAAGLQASFLNQPIEISSIRLQLTRQLTLPEQPQLLLRSDVARARRRLHGDYWPVCWCPSGHR